MPVQTDTGAEFPADCGLRIANRGLRTRGLVHAGTGADRHAGQQQRDEQVTAGIALTKMPLDFWRPGVGGGVDERGELVGVGAVRLAPWSDYERSIHSQE